MALSSINNLIARLRSGPAERERFVESHLGKGIAYQIRAIRDRLSWSQAELAAKVGMTQNAISRLESSEYGKPTITTLKRLAAAFDVALVVRFVPFSEMVHWASSTPYRNMGLSTESLAVPTFEMEEEKQVFDSLAASVESREDALVAALSIPTDSAYVIGTAYGFPAQGLHESVSAEREAFNIHSYHAEFVGSTPRTMIGSPIQNRFPSLPSMSIKPEVRSAA